MKISRLISELLGFAKVILIPVVVMLMTASAYADTLTWNATGDDHTWSPGTNWNLFHSPYPFDSVTFGSAGSTTSIVDRDFFITNISFTQDAPSYFWPILTVSSAKGRILDSERGQIWRQILIMHTSNSREKQVPPPANSSADPMKVLWNSDVCCKRNTRKV